MGGASAETSGSRETGSLGSRRSVSIAPPRAGRGAGCPGERLNRAWRTARGSKKAETPFASVNES